MEKPRTLTLELLDNGRVAVSFPYNEEVISRLRALTDRKWDPEKRRWDVGICHLNELVDIFHLQPGEVDRRLTRAYQMYRIRHGRARINAGNLDAVLTGVNLPLEKIDRHTSFQIPGYRFMTRYKKGAWDGRRHLFNMNKGTFPSGLSQRVARIVREAGVDCDINWPEEPDSYRLPLPPADGGSGARKGSRKKSSEAPGATAVAEVEFKPSVMREYQQNCVEAALKDRRGIIEIATGGGKTLIAANLIRSIARPALFLVHTRDLMYQTIAVLERELGIRIGCAGDGKIDLQPVTVATVQTCARSMDIKLDQSPDDDEVLQPEKAVEGDSAAELQQHIRSVPVVFFDECHHLPADTAYSLAMEMEGAVWRYGLSATPYRADRQDMLMEAALGPKLFSARASMLIELGYLVPPTVKFLPVPPLIVKNGKADYQEIYNSYVVENKKRNRLIADTAREMSAEGKSVLILVNQVRHGELLQELLDGVPLVQGSDPAADRDVVFKDLCAKRQMVVIATTLADEGLDVPSLDCVILASAGRSETRALQRLGRALRLAPGKTRATVIDFMDNAPYLREHAANRLELFRTEPKFTVEY